MAAANSAIPSFGAPLFCASSPAFTCRRISCRFPSPSAALAILPASASESTVWMTSNRRTASLALFDCRCPIRCQTVGGVACTSDRFSRASCTRFSPMSVMPASIASSTAAPGKVLETAMSETVSVLRPAREQAAVIRARTAATFSRTGTAALHPTAAGPNLGAVECQVGKAVGIFVSGAQRVPDREAAEVAGHRARPLVQRHQGRMLYAVLAEHLLDEQQGVADDLELIGAFLARHVERLQQAGVLRDVVRRRAEVAADLDDFGVAAHEHTVACRSGIAAARSVDECNEFLQGAGLSR